jgi:hypothetical protein
MKTVEMKENGVPLLERFQQFPWLLSELVFPFMMEYLVSCKSISDYGKRLTVIACLVPHLGDYPEYPGRVDLLCRPKLLRCLVEQR